VHDNDQIKGDTTLYIKGRVPFNLEPERRLRIGYVSPDFRQHSLGLLIEPILASHDHKNFTIVCYSDAKHPDALTQKIKSHADFFESTVALTDGELAERIRRDKIDILIDLTNHMQSNRLLTFARKPAPIQANYLAYPETTGLSAMDYLITDVHLHPPESAAPSSEKLIRLPETYWAYPAQPDAPEVAPLPALSNNFVTFGCLNNFCKLNDAVLALWREVLAAVPNSRLHLLVNSRDGQSERSWLGAHHLPMDRITLLQKQPRRKYLDLFNQIDLSLDPFPCAGHTTSLDSLYMGVPVVTLPGAAPFSRAGLSQLSNLNLADFIAASPADYIRIAGNRSSDLPRLAELRANLRQRMLSSPLCDAPRLARHLESIYRTMWKNFCS
jgi:protein O-GlcNAc transferase